MHVQTLFAATDPAAAVAEIRQQVSGKHREGEARPRLDHVPAWLIVDSLLHYRCGPYLVGQLSGTDFTGTMRRLFDAPPTTQEQFLHPSRWLGKDGRDLPRTLHWGGAWDQVVPGWSVLADVPVGELTFAMLLDYFLSEDEGRLRDEEVLSGQYVCDPAHAAASGWDAGRSVVLEGPGDALIVAHALAFDAPDDAREAARALQRAMRARNRRVWKTPKAWQSQPVEDGRQTPYLDGRGMGTILWRGREVLWLDGLPAPDRWTPETRPVLIDPLVAHLEATRFEQQPADRGDTLGADPRLDGCTLVLKRRGLGFRVPTTAWRVTERVAAAGIGKPVVSIARKGASLQVSAVDQGGMAKASLPVLLATQVPDFDETRLVPCTVAGWDGWRYPALKTPGRQLDLYAGTDGVRVVLVVAQGVHHIMRLYDDEIEDIVARIVSVPGY